MSRRIRRIVVLGVIVAAAYGLGYTAALFVVSAWASSFGYFGDGILAGAVVSGCVSGIVAFVVGDLFLMPNERQGKK